jgi:hypothetical protein
VPSPRVRTLRYARVLASRSRFRSRIVKRQVEVAPGEKPPPRRHRMPYAELTRRTFRIDVETCGHCGSRMKLLALIKEPRGITRFLRHLGLPTEPPTRAPPRDEPYWQSIVLRREAKEGLVRPYSCPRRPRRSRRQTTAGGETNPDTLARSDR